MKERVLSMGATRRGCSEFFFCSLLLLQVLTPRPRAEGGDESVSGHASHELGVPLTELCRWVCVP